MGVIGSELNLKDLSNKAEAEEIKVLLWGFSSLRRRRPSGPRDSGEII